MDTLVRENQKAENSNGNGNRAAERFVAPIATVLKPGWLHAPRRDAGLEQGRSRDVG